MDDPVHGPVAAPHGPDGVVLPPRLDHIVDDLTPVNELPPPLLPEQQCGWTPATALTVIAVACTYVE
jgi:hypothetical protein